MAAATGPSWQEKDLLTVLQRRNARPGNGVPVNSVVDGWWRLGGNRSVDDFTVGLDRLAARGWIKPVEGSTADIVITDDGLRAMR